MLDYEEKNATNLLLSSPAIPSRIIMPDGGAIRARKVVHRSNHGHPIKLSSLKCGRIIELESGLEYDRAVLLEMDSDVVEFQEQPFRLEYAYNGAIKKILISTDLPLSAANSQISFQSVQQH